MDYHKNRFGEGFFFSTPRAFDARSAAGNYPMVGMTVVVAVAIEEASK